ncbi:DinB family protein [Pedobacter nyackensis]|uniref:DinB family protein n=1 Tax=Pedobacter nyackensis TaxID=475255 RepID=UPI00292DD86F|nr:DinB family protein [Pedobacter nyackensis]
MNKREIIAALQSTITEFQELISAFDEAELNNIPFEGSWTAGQVAQHIIMANSGFGEVLNGPVTETKRIPDELCGKLKEDFLNFNIKMESPDFIIPKYKAYNKKRLLNALEEIKNDIAKAIIDIDLTQTCLAFELPVYGHLTRFEAVCFVIYHTQRHAHQVRNIKDHFNMN